MIIYKVDDITVRNIEIQDEQTLVVWLSDPKVLEFYAGRDRPHDLAMVREQYSTEMIMKFAASGFDI